MNFYSLFYLPILVSGMFVLAACKPSDKTGGRTEAQATEETVAEEEVEVVPANDPSNSMVLLHAANQPYDYRQPWNKQNTRYYSGFAVYLGGGRFLTTASIVSHAGFLELLSADGSKTITGRVSAADYEANLAILEAVGDNRDGFIDGLVPMELADAPSLGERVDIWQFNDEGVPIIASGVIESTQSNVPLTHDIAFLLYQIKSAVNSVTGGATMPVVKEGRLVGISLSNETSEQTILSLTTQTIQSFLERALGDKPYEGLPVFGARLGELLDPVLRKYLKVPEKGDGVYVLDVTPGSSADQAEIREGDVLVSVNGKAVDGRGILQDDLLGPVNCAYYLHDLNRIGDVLDIGVMRDGILRNVKVTMDRKAFDDSIIPGNYEITQPKYIVYGGLVFQPLTRTFMSEVFESNPNKMPIDVIEVLDEKEEYRKEGRDEIIMLSNILPTAATHGYGNFAGAILKKVDGQIPKNMKHLSEILDGVDQDIVVFETNKAPFTIYFSRKDAEAANNYINQVAIPKLRNL